ncbi:Hypothetical protein MexAM1_META2p1103 (plasmid) [Methylorubrum extorquens AM1]|uniref:Uncharacterized protein n=1 Tax=Methylorubrum extorquens (strain ATCC 14718 / DSM 1338 / JCM 2805 / NCIMB 9133 / AM1) TaxID=272630 RepID=C5B5Z8_METEA|nr:Hypothetical protein MexAM1_META2p1103 [Methylorubrum extorquens AM1]
MGILKTAEGRARREVITCLARTSVRGRMGRVSAGRGRPSSLGYNLRPSTRRDPALRQRLSGVDAHRHLLPWIDAMARRQASVKRCAQGIRIDTVDRDIGGAGIGLPVPG